MPSVTDLQQQSSKMTSNTNDNITTSTPQQQQQINSTSTGASGNATSIDPANADPLTQAVLMLEKKQRNLGKRKEKLESYNQEAKSGKELNKDQKEALSKYGEVIGQIECAKDIHEQLKKLQADLAKSQKRTLKQAAEEKRTQQAQRLRELVQLRYLLDHRPSSLKAEESSLLDDLTRIVILSDLSTNNINRCIDTVLAIYQGGSPTATIKGINGRNAQEVRETIEQLVKVLELPPPASLSSLETSTPQPPPTTTTLANEPVKQTPVTPQTPSTTPASVLPQRKQHQSTSNDVLPVNAADIGQIGQAQPLPHLSHPNEYPLQFDTRNQNIPLQKIMQDYPYFMDNSSGNNSPQVLQDASNNQQQQQIGMTDETTVAQSPDPKQYLPTMTVTNSSIAAQAAPQGYSESSSAAIGPNDEQQPQSDEQWQQRRGTGGGAHRGGQYNNGAGQRNYSNRGGGPNNYHQQNQWRGARGGFSEGGAYGGGQRQQTPYNENNNRGGGGQRPGPNPNYRGNRGGGYRGGHRGGGGYNAGADNYQKSSHYPQNNGQQVRSAPPTQQQ